MFIDKKKYIPTASNYLKIWSVVQLVITFLIMLFLVIQLVDISKPAIFVYGFFIFYSVYCYTSLMDKDSNAWLLECIRFALAIGIIKYYNGWFTLNKFVDYGTTILVAYFVISLLVSVAFVLLEFKKEMQISKA